MRSQASGGNQWATVGKSLSMRMPDDLEGSMARLDTFNVKWSLRTILQFDETKANSELTSLETTKNFNADFLLTYLVNPGTAAFFGYNSNYQNFDLIRPPGGQRGESSLVRSDSGRFNDTRGLFVKISYLFRL